MSLVNQLLMVAPDVDNDLFNATGQPPVYLVRERAKEALQAHERRHLIPART